MTIIINSLYSAKPLVKKTHLVRDVVKLVLACICVGSAGGGPCNNKVQFSSISFI